MENDEQSVDLFNFIAWLQVNQKRIITIAIAIVILGGIVALYIGHKNSVEKAASTALSNIQIRTSTNVPPAEPFVKIADDYPKTQAGARALLIGAGYYFEAGKYDQAQKTFSRFLGDYPDSSFANQASLGVAASYEAEGNTTNAIARYDDLLKHHTADSTTPQVKSALARLYVAAGRPERSAELYEELSRAGANDTWSAEASIQLQELYAKYPNLRKTNTVATGPRTGSTITVPGH